MRSKKIFKAIISFLLVFAGLSDLASQTCTANFNASVGSNGLVTFSNTSVSGGTQTSYFWNFPGGSPNTSTVTSPVVSYSLPGTYTISLTIVTSGPTCTNIATYTINIPPTCSASIAYTAASNGTTCDGAASVTAATACSPLTYTWAPGGFSTPNVSGLCAGVYTVMISGSSGSVTCCPLVTQTVQVDSCSAKASFTAIPGPNGSYSFVNLSTGIGSNPSYLWKFGDGNISTLPAPSHTYASNGTYFVSLILDAGPNCLDSIMLPINVSSYTCNAAFIHSVFPNGYVQFTNTSVPSSTSAVVSFDFGNGNITPPATGVYTVGTTYTTSGTYSVTITVTVNGCVSSKTYTVNVLTTPVPCSVQASFQHSPSVNGIVDFWSTSTGTTVNSNYSWTSNTGFTAGSPTTTITFPSPGKYVVFLQVTDGLCTSGKVDTIIVSSFSCNLVSSFAHTVSGQGNVTFSSTTIGAGSNSTYTWFFGDGTSGSGKNTFHSYSNAGSHLVSLVVTSGNCHDSTTMSVNITGITCSANSNFTLVPSFTPHYWNAIPFYPWNVTAAKWSWGDGTTSDSLYVTHQYSVSSTYNICLTVTVSCGDTSTTCSPYYVYRNSQSANTIYYVNVVPPNYKVVGLNDYTSVGGADIFPNPNDGTFYIKWDQSQNSPGRVRIVDLLGSVVFESEIENAGDASSRVVAPNLPEGIYFVELTQKNNRVLKKMVIRY